MTENSTDRSDRTAGSTAPASAGPESAGPEGTGHPSRSGLTRRRALGLGVGTAAVAGASGLVGAAPASADGAATSGTTGTRGTAAAVDAAALRRSMTGLAVRGADISFTLQEEAAGTRYRVGGRVRPIERILADAGATWVRLRVWVDPPEGYSTLADAIVLARRAIRQGLQVLVDFHLSDFWADPGKQVTPAAWVGLDLEQLSDRVRSYLASSVRRMIAAGAAPSMVAVGNEITPGILFPLGQLYPTDAPQNWTGFTTLLKAGLDGVALAGGRKIPTMVHIDRGGDNGGSRWFYDHLVDFGVRWDVIGLSYYPFWHGPLDQMAANVADLQTRYGKPVVLAETAYPWTLADGDDEPNILADLSALPDATHFPPTPAGQVAYFEALRGALLSVPGGGSAGFFDWEPGWLPGVGWEPGAGNPNDNLTMFDFAGQALPSLAAFRRPRRARG